MSAEADSTAHIATRVYKTPMGTGWWTRKRHYFLYMVREFTALPMAAWLLWFLIEIQRSGSVKTFRPGTSTAFVIFSVICLLFALYHSVTFLSLAGVIIHIKALDRPVPPRAIVLTMFGLWLVASVVIGAVLIGFGR
jgi:succinate dehydrogenase subunit C